MLLYVGPNVHSSCLSQQGRLSMDLRSLACTTVMRSRPPGPEALLRRCFLYEASVSTYLRLGSTISFCMLFVMASCHQTVQLSSTRVLDKTISQQCYIVSALHKGIRGNANITHLACFGYAAPMTRHACMLEQQKKGCARWYESYEGVELFWHLGIQGHWNAVP